MCKKKLSLFGLGRSASKRRSREVPELKSPGSTKATPCSSKDYEHCSPLRARRDSGAAGDADDLQGPGLSQRHLVGSSAATPSWRCPIPRRRADVPAHQQLRPGGAGRFGGASVLQLFPEDPTIQAAIRQDFVGSPRRSWHNGVHGTAPFGGWCGSCSATRPRQAPALSERPSPPTSPTRPPPRGTPCGSRARCPARSAGSRGISATGGDGFRDGRAASARAHDRPREGFPPQKPTNRVDVTRCRCCRPHICSGVDAERSRPLASARDGIAELRLLERTGSSLCSTGQFS